MKKILKNTQNEYKDNKELSHIIHSKLDLIDEVIDLINCSNPLIHPIKCDCDIVIN